MTIISIFKKSGFWLSFGLTLVCAFAGSFLAQLPYLSLVGALVLALLLGMLLHTSPVLLSGAQDGTGFISNKFLRLGIILLGFKLNLIQLAQAGVKSILLAICIVAGMITLTYWVSRKFGGRKRACNSCCDRFKYLRCCCNYGCFPPTDQSASRKKRKTSGK